MNCFYEIVVQCAVVEKKPCRIVFRLQLLREAVEALCHGVELADDGIRVVEDAVRLRDEGTQRRACRVKKRVHLCGRGVQTLQTFFELRVRLVDHDDQAVFNVFGLVDESLELRAELRVRDGAVHHGLNRLDKNLGAVEKFAGESERFRDARVEVSVYRIVRRKIIGGIAEDDADLTFAHDADVLHADFGTARNFHIGAETDSYEHAVSAQVDVLDFSEFHAVHLDGIIQRKRTHLREPQVECIECLPGVLVVQEEQAENKNDYGQKDDKTDSEV